MPGPILIGALCFLMALSTPPGEEPSPVALILSSRTGLAVQIQLFDENGALRLRETLPPGSLLTGSAPAGTRLAILDPTTGRERPVPLLGSRQEIARIIRLEDDSEGGWFSSAPRLHLLDRFVRDREEWSETCQSWSLEPDGLPPTSGSGGFHLEPVPLQE